MDWVLLDRLMAQREKRREDRLIEAQEQGASGKKIQNISRKKKKVALLQENEEEPKLFRPKAYMAHSTYKALQIYLKSNTEQWDC